ncbi:hypothetical protein M404DRAFT_914919 [Pisolithus tinctorius Marx 270]|uniref:Uncharacterized protein n=1 Tax=Pisolithus tinctorius Marx 270 TaxID=870435 RepID=A0A0C3PNY3_PISTI|nr:hypothetical protein M404DRAFT_914919 [Pisolithus tinctorius Marx 270]
MYDLPTMLPTMQRRQRKKKRKRKHSTADKSNENERGKESSCKSHIQKDREESPLLLKGRVHME